MDHILLRDKRLFEIRKVEITRVDCTTTSCSTSTTTPIIIIIIIIIAASIKFGML